MESSVLVAIITAITSIIVALIQMTASLKVASLKTPPAQPAVVAGPPQVPVSRSSPYRAWQWIGTILVVSNILWLAILGTLVSYPLQFGAVLWCTCLLAYFRPIPWPYVAGAVTLFNMIWLLASYLQVGAWRSEDLVMASGFYLVNAIVATLIAYLRMRNQTTQTGL